ncbi:MAG: type IV pilus secretin PilQ [Candidatus Acidiferrales bacterium]
MRMIRQPWGLALLFAATLFSTSGILRAESAPVVRLNSEVKDGVVRLVAQATGPFGYTTSRPNRSLFVLDLSGVSAPVPTAARTVDSRLVSGYRVLSYGGAKPIVRVEVRMSADAEPKVERAGTSELTLIVAGTSLHASPTASTDDVPVTDAKPSNTSAPGIEHVRLEQSGGDTEVNVTGSAPLTYHVSRLAHPDRIVLDFTGAQVKTSDRNIASNLEPVRAIRLAQFSPEVARVVIELRALAPYTVNAKGNTVTVDFVGGSATKGSAKGAADANASSVNTTQNVAPVSAPSVALPASLTQANAGLASEPDTKKAVGAPGPTGTDATKAAADAQQASTPAPSGRYSGEPISVNLKDVDLRDFFRLIHEISGLNIVVDPNVKGNLTIVLDDVPWDQALDIVLHNNDLEKQLDGNVLRIATRDTIKKEAQEAHELSQAQAEAADIITTTRVLSYAKSDEIVATLRKFSSSRGDVIGDARSNTVIIRDIPSVLPVMDNLIRQLDRKSQQVEIEARVVAANRNFASAIGTQWAFSAGTASRNNVFGGDQGVGTSELTRGPGLPTPPLVVSTGSSSGSQMPLSVGLGAAAPTSGISYGFTSRNFALDLIIDAAETKGVGKLISKPRLITQNNQKAQVKQGTKIPVQTIVNNTISVQFVDAVLQLEVTPQITAEGTIFMDVKVTNDQIDQAIPRVEGIPAIDTQEEDTRVTISDGGTVVIGGIIVSNQQTAVSQVPLFGSLPIIGNLFRNTTVSSTSQELLFFLTPRILPN